MSDRNRVREEFRIVGTIEEQETGRPLANLVVRAFDRDLIADDKVGFTRTDDDGRFEIHFGPEMFRDLFEARPDLYLRIYDQNGSRLLHETTDAIRWNAQNLEQFDLRISARTLD